MPSSCAAAMNGGAIRQVWKDNFQAESAVLCSIARRARHVALTVQCPVCTVAAQAAGCEQRQYDVLLKPIQVGLAICTDDGELFVFEFNLNGNFDGGNPAAAELMETIGGESSVDRQCLIQLCGLNAH